jgi:hypothetical protein
MGVSVMRLESAGIDLPGVIDMHLHFGPLPVPPKYRPMTHSVTAIQAAREAAEAGFAAIVLKAKDGPTTGIAHAVQEVVDGVRVFGGIVLDYAAGGLNLSAVEQALWLGAKIVWLPTSCSRTDCELFGPPALRPMPGLGTRPGIPVLDDDGKLLDEVYEIFELVQEHDALLATGHIGFEEHLAVAREFGASGRVVATHAGAHVGARLGVAQCAELASQGMIMEFAAQTCIDHWGTPAMPMEAHAAMIRAAGVEHAVLSSDYGIQLDENIPKPVDGMRDYYEKLWNAGFAEVELRRMACDNPARLLALG